MIGHFACSCDCSFWSHISANFNWLVWELSFYMKVFSFCLDFLIWCWRGQGGSASIRFRFHLILLLSLTIEIEDMFHRMKFCPSLLFFLVGKSILYSLDVVLFESCNRFSNVSPSSFSLCSAWWGFQRFWILTMMWLCLREKYNFNFGSYQMDLIW